MTLLQTGSGSTALLLRRVDAEAIGDGVGSDGVWTESGYGAAAYIAVYGTLVACGSDRCDVLAAEFVGGTDENAQ